VRDFADDAAIAAQGIQCEQHAHDKFTTQLDDNLVMIMGESNAGGGGARILPLWVSARWYRHVAAVLMTLGAFELRAIFSFWNSPLSLSEREFIVTMFRAACRAALCAAAVLSLMLPTPTNADDTCVPKTCSNISG
jgi:hypothetical protein